MSVESRRRRLLRASSQRLNVVLGICLVAILVLSLALRFYGIEPIRIDENSMEPDIAPGSRIWICKLPSCKKDLKRDDIVLVSMPGERKTLRVVFGLPGDSVHLAPEGFVSAGNASYRFDDESEIVAPRTFYIPQKGDSIKFKELNDISFDYASEFLRKKFDSKHFYTQTTLWRGENALNLSRVGSTHLFGRPVSIREIHGLHWQEYFLIALQINREDPGMRAVHFERKLYHATDSSEVKSFLSSENAYYVLCRKGNRCEDSRMFGYIPESHILGKVLNFREFFK